MNAVVKRRIAAACCIGLLAQSGPLVARPASDCGRAFTGFDSRLAVELVGIVPADAGMPVGFEITAKGPVVATARTLYAITAEGAVPVPLDQAISGIAVDASGRLVLQSEAGVGFVGKSGLEPIAPWTNVVLGQVLNSGEPSFIEAIVKDGVTSFAVRMPTTNRTLPIAQLTGPFRAGAWDRHGLLAAVGQSVVRWGSPGTSLELIAADSGLDETTGVCALSSSRALVLTRSATLLFTGKTPSVVAGVGGRCRTTENGTTFIFDPHLRRVWKLTDTQDLGDPAKDLAQATRLVQLGVAQGTAFSATQEFTEAVRLIGCRKATEIAEQLQR
jgi:hypothetical protein